MSVLLLFGLTACSQSTEEKIVGDWQVIEAYFENKNTIIGSSSVGEFELIRVGNIEKETEEVETEQEDVKKEEITNEEGMEYFSRLLESLVKTDKAETEQEALDTFDWIFDNAVEVERTKGRIR